MSMIEKKISARLLSPKAYAAIDQMVSLALSESRFDSPDELQEYLTEGSMLNIGVLAGRALAVPHGDYMVWMTEAGHTMLVPVADAGRPGSDDIFRENQIDKVEVSTSKLLGIYDKIAKVLEEADDSGFKSDQFVLSVDKSSVERTALMNAMERAGMSATDLADACGVDVPAISRLLRKPKDTTGRNDPGGRNPSMELAAKIAQVLSTTVENLFGDIFKAAAKKGDSQRKGNSQSGNSNKGVNFNGFKS
jgi:transcriptional regulator with XRE-family HTH domain